VYREPVRVRNDAVEALRQQPALQPRCAPVAQGAGRAVIYLVGTVPVQYNGATYNIPVSVWITEAYPYECPAAYVTPTPDMIIKPKHRHVDSQGKVYLQYLTDWSSSGSTLHQLFAQMSDVFSKDPPVRARPKGSASSTRSQGSGVSASSSKAASPAVSSAGSGRAAAGGGSYEDPATVIRRNAIAAATDKIQRELRRFYDKAGAEMSELMGNEVASAASREDAELRALERETAVLERKAEELRAWLAENESESGIDVDAVTEPRDPLSKQLLHLVAEDAAIEDTLYYYEKALVAGTLPTDTFVKVYRQLSREQYEKRALMKKVHAAQREAKRS
jgi:ESCRT-I complex subunit TSG101